MVTTVKVTIEVLVGGSVLEEHIYVGAQAYVCVADKDEPIAKLQENCTVPLLTTIASSIMDNKKVAFSVLQRSIGSLEARLLGGDE